LAEDAINLFPFRTVEKIQTKFFSLNQNNDFRARWQRFQSATLRWREKMHSATTAADCAEMRILCKTGHFVHFGEIGDSPDKLFFHFHSTTILPEI
jgi:hypothetical protein